MSKSFPPYRTITIGTIFLLSLCLSPLILLSIQNFQSKIDFDSSNIEYFRVSILIGIIISIHNFCILLIDFRNGKQFEIQTMRLFFILAIFLPNITTFLLSFDENAAIVSIATCIIDLQLCMIFLGILCHSQYIFDEPTTLKFGIALNFCFVSSVVINSFSNVFSNLLDLILNSTSAFLLIFSFILLIRIYLHSKLSFSKYLILKSKKHKSSYHEMKLEWTLFSLAIIILGIFGAVIFRIFGYYSLNTISFLSNIQTLCVFLSFCLEQQYLHLSLQKLQVYMYIYMYIFIFTTPFSCMKTERTG